jgi:hypothetical protein
MIIVKLGKKYGHNTFISLNVRRGKVKIKLSLCLTN